MALSHELFKARLTSEVGTRKSSVERKEAHFVYFEISCLKRAHVPTESPLV